MTEMLSLQPASPPKRSWGILKLCFWLLVITAIFLLWFVFSRIENRANLTLNLVPVATPISTTLTELFVAPSQNVQKGQRLVRIDIAGYSEQLPHASALVRGTFSGDISSRLADAENMAANMVMRTAMARHEENSMRQAVEHYSTEHARTLVQLRGMTQSNTQKYRNAVQAELRTRQQLQSAKAKFELASRQRVAIEDELYRIRAERVHNPAYIPSTNLNTEQGASSLIVAEHILANVDGYLVGNIPKVGDVLAKGAVLFHILPETGANFTIRLNLSAENAAQLHQGSIIYLMLKHGIIHGKIEDIQAQGNSNFVLKVSNGDADVMERLQAYITGELQDKAQAKAVDASSMQSGNLFSGQVVPISVVFWPENMLTEQLTPLYSVIIPMLNAVGSFFE